MNAIAAIDTMMLDREIAKIEREEMRAEEMDLRDREIEACRAPGGLRYYWKAAYADYLNLPTLDKVLWNWHHDAMAEHMEAFIRGQIPRLNIMVPPGHHKSTCGVVIAPSFGWVIDPSLKFLCFSTSPDNATRDGRASRTIMDGDWYRSRFRGTRGWDWLKDQNEKGYFENNKRGFRVSQSITAKKTGKRGNRVIIDDPHDANDVLSEVIRKEVLREYDDAIQSRLNEPKTDGICNIMQRLHTNDLVGHVTAKAREEGWVNLCLMQEFERKHPMVYAFDPRKVEGELLWTRNTDKAVVARQKKTMSSFAYSGQMQQRPNPAGGGILKRTDWRIWDTKLMGKAPKCHLIIDSWDTAFSEDAEKKGSRSAMSRWGVFWNEKHQRNCIILLYSWAAHVDYPTLRKKAMDEFKTHKADTVLIEKKASGQSLIQDLRQAGVPVVGYNPDRDKIARAHAVSALLESGVIYYIEGKVWAEEHVDECANFPRGQYADLVDTTTQAWLRVRNLWMVEHPDNPETPHEDDADRDDAAEQEKRPMYG